MSEALTDEDLLSGVRAGRRDLFAELVRRYERELFGYLKRYVGQDDLAADVFQNTFLAVFTKIDQYQPGRAARPWLYTIATHQAIDALRRRQRRTGRVGPHGPDQPEPDGTPAPGPAPPDAAAGAETRERVRQAVDALPDLMKQVVLLAYFQGLKYQEIADALDIPLGTVKSRLHAALAKLGENWPEEEGE